MDGIASALLAPGVVGMVPLATDGLTAPRPVATKDTVAPGAALTMAVFAEDGGMTPCATKSPKSEVAKPIRKGALVAVPVVTVTFSEGTPAGISNGICTFTCVGLMNRIGAAMPPILTDVPASVRGAAGGKGTKVAPLVRFEP
jgi:hypothetical protein